MEQDYTLTEFARGAMAAIDKLAAEESGTIHPLRVYFHDAEKVKVEAMYMPDPNLAQFRITVEQGSIFSEIFGNKKAKIEILRCPPYVLN